MPGNEIVDSPCNSLIPSVCNSRLGDFTIPHATREVVRRYPDGSNPTVFRAVEERSSDVSVVFLEGG
jgi:hypothetical protein